MPSCYVTHIQKFNFIPQLILKIILQFDWSIASKAITQDILSVMEFEMEVKYQNNSPFRLFYRK